MHVLVTDGQERSALALVRSLGGAGHRLYVCSTSGRSLAGASRYTRGEAATPHPLTDPDGYLDAVCALVERWRIDTLLPVSEESLLSVLPARERLSGVLLPFPPIEAFRAISDKAAVLDAARALGIATPAQLVLDSPDDRMRLDLEALRYPLVLKPTRSVAERVGQYSKLRVAYAADRATLLRELDAVPEEGYPLLLQQRIVGPGVGVFLLIWDGEVRLVFSHRRIREKPPAGGVSVYAESIPADPWLVDASRRLLDHFGWQGVAMVEYKLDAETGTPYLMEVNGRFWGSLQLAVDAGADFPAALLAAARGEVRSAPAEYRCRVRNRWWWGDIDQLLLRLRRSPRILALPPGAPGRWRSVLDFLVLWRPGDRNQVFRFRDPYPAIRESIDWFRRSQ